MTELVYPEESYSIMGACFDVYKEMGCGFLEPVYQECVEKEFRRRGLPFESQSKLRLTYKGEELEHVYVADLICFGKVIVEIKAVSKLTDEHRAQLLNYLHATGMKLGILVSFGHFPKVEYERIALTESKGFRDISRI